MRIPISLILLSFILAEIAVFILVGETVGVLATLALTLFGMVAGALLLRTQGMATIARVRAEAANRRTPARSLFDGAAFAVAALLLMLPGFISDVAALILLVPAVRERIWLRLRRKVEIRAARRGASAEGHIVELDRSEYAAPPRPNSPWRRLG